MTVKDFEQTADWYRRVFGFEVVEKGIYKGSPWGVIRSGDAMLCIYEHPELAAGAGEGMHHINHFGLRITDPPAWEETIEREGVPVLFGGPVRWPRSTSW